MTKTFTVRGMDNLCALTSIERHLNAILENPVDAQERCYKIDNLMRWLHRRGQNEAYGALLLYWTWLDWKYLDTVKEFLRAFEENRRILANEHEERRLAKIKDQKEGD